MNILICEDDVVNQLLFKVVFKDCANLFIASNGKEGLEIFKKEKIDLIITDINMPVKNGIEFIKDIRKIDKDVPIIVCSSEDLEILNKIVCKNNVAFLPKKITKEIIPIVYEMLNLKKVC